MNRFEAIIAERTEARRRTAEVASGEVLSALNAKNIDISVFGSLARGDFRVHSDVDFLVRGPINSEVRVAVETTVSKALIKTGLPYDIIYLADLTSEQAAVFDNA